MKDAPIGLLVGWLAVALASAPFAAHAHKLRERGAPVAVADTPLTVTPSRDWNRLDVRLGKNTEHWTVDGEQLNDVTFFAAIAPGQPLVRERSKKREPLPKFTTATLLVEVPELLETTWRTYKRSGSFQMTGIEPGRFLGADGVHFTYEFVDQDELPRRGEARAAIIAGKLYMISFEAPRLHYFAAGIEDFRKLADSARLP
ncbi:hypothetical protein [Blastomonas fulva]|uniref:hypothetical protein n=1 Tax=Blastomonas fulva TaxID=1550728 RepID=UPI0025A432AA|nr:hypothetical protein [Blastomonas fulva]MDM7927439.1 hypothetical protein [Blastomonas fulva]MDM7964879.1 hypothetical protein [Blastomonas fulva]